MEKNMYGENRRFGSGGGFAPVKVGDEFDVEIESVGEKGDGLARIKGFVLFVPGVKQGDKVKIKVNRVLRKVGFAEVVGEASGEIENQEDSAEEDSAEETTEETTEEVAEESTEEPAEEGAEEPAEEEKPKEQGEDVAAEEEPQDSEEF